ANDQQRGDHRLRRSTPESGLRETARHLHCTNSIFGLSTGRSGRIAKTYAPFQPKRGQNGRLSTTKNLRINRSSRMPEFRPSNRSMAEDPGGSGQITRLLRDWQSGDRDALDRLIPLVYDELHLIASRHMSREWRDSTIQTTGLVNEAYTKLVDQRNVD